ncbi:hypothetical protein [Algoriphagus winogradskyi]|uniref:Uncharacterized protein n=1 Tax=Algoriphagus winogradskyi TaxID=237017 RepID=A0ABY1NYB8_9BACT|nr:hypothetical protein [Algoriphagus winogradskyi]SMP22000.1 hypothetical protein SAMN06265367_103393 [Algoriphagus winogradskyi]
MKTLLKIYLILIFASSALNAGSDNDSIVKGSGIRMEGSSFVTTSTYPQNLEGIADCMNSSGKNVYNKAGEALREKESATKVGELVPR